MPSASCSRAVRPGALLAAAAVSLALCAQTVNLTPGLYELTSTSDLRLPPDVAAKMPPRYLAMMQKPHVSQHCISQADLDHVGQQLAAGRGGPAQSCRISDRSMSGSTVKFTMQCERSSAHFEGTFAPESFQGTMVSSGEQGQAVTVRIAARRIGDCGK